MKYSNLLEGLSEGTINSIRVESNVIDYSIDAIDLEKYSSEFYIGYGIGLEQGKVIKDQIKTAYSNYEIGSSLLLDAISIYQYKFEEEIKKITDKIEIWNSYSIDFKIMSEVLKAIDENNIFRVIITLFDFYKAGYQIGPMLKINKYLDEYNALRLSKKNQTIDSIDYLDIKKNIDGRFIKFYHKVENNF